MAVFRVHSLNNTMHLQAYCLSEHTQYGKLQGRFHSTPDFRLIKKMKTICMHKKQINAFFL